MENREVFTRDEVKSLMEIARKSLLSDLLNCQSENESLQKRVRELDKQAAMWYDDTITLQKEVERLKEALEQIKVHLSDTECAYSPEEAEEMVNKAIAVIEALNP
jgi:phage shock protein A